MQNQGNIQFEEMGAFSFEGKTSDIPMEEKAFDSLYEELNEKCNPNRFLYPFVLERFELANRLYDELQKSQKRDDASLKDIRDRAMAGLGIHISTHRLYEYLMKYCYPGIYTDIKPYDKERVLEAGRLYGKMQKSKDDIHALEVVEKEASDFIKKRQNELREQQEKERERQQALERERKDKEEAVSIVEVVVIGVSICILFVSIVVLIAYASQ